MLVCILYMPIPEKLSRQRQKKNDFFFIMVMDLLILKTFLNIFFIEIFVANKNGQKTEHFN